MILKEFQRRTLDQVAAHVRNLALWREKAQDLDPDLEFDWAERAWQKTVPGRPYTPRRNGLGEPLPAFCLKIPTGGGKTLLAVKVIDRVNTDFRKSQTGLVLWIVPTTQIYNQTRSALKDRDHPYRQHLDVASAGRTLILDKTTAFTPQQVKENLCVLMLMLPSANRETKAQLRMFRDSGGFQPFFPGDDEVAAHRALLERIPNLDTFEKTGGHWGGQIKTSLGNALRLLHPLIVLDEGHKAYSQKARETLEGFNPSMIVELSATPPKGANILVEISGRELNAEEMVKLDLHIQNKASVSWQDTLLAAIEHRIGLEETAKKHEENTGDYNRPICLIQVERTGKEQRKAGFIHAEDVRDYLLRHTAIGPEQVAVKTSQKDELKEVDEVGGLMSRNCQVRYIITKQALQEGWDCAFAYVLAILTNPGSRSALTQLVGRILRQPRAAKTGVPALDESYVFCFQRDAKALLDEVRKGFGQEGLDDLRNRIRTDDWGALHTGEKAIAVQRDRFRRAAAGFVLPTFMIRDRRHWRLVHYETDILSRIPWDEVDLDPVLALPLDEHGVRDQVLRAGIDGTGRTDDGDPPEIVTAEPDPDGEMDYYFAANHLNDVLPNPWRAAEAARRVFDSLMTKHPRSKVTANYIFVLEELRKRLEVERDRLSRQVFSGLLDSGTMRFIVVTDDLGVNRLPLEITYPKTERQATKDDRSQFERNLFDRTNESDLNGLENKVAAYLDGQERLFFWYRNRARKDYYVQGWKRHRIYADFIVTLQADEPDSDDEFHRVFVVETKGVHLKHSEDTDYKRSVFDLCSKHAKKTDWATFVPAMHHKILRFEVVDEDEWQRRLHGLFDPEPDPTSAERGRR